MSFSRRYVGFAANAAPRLHWPALDARSEWNLMLVPLESWLRQSPP